MERRLDGFLIGGQRDVGVGFGGFHAGFGAARVEDRAGELRTDRVDPRFALEQVVEVLGDHATTAGERQVGEPQRLRHPDLGRGSLEILVGCGNVRPASQQ